MNICTVKLGDNELFDKEQIGVKEPFPPTKFQIYFIKDKEHLALRNNFRVTKKFLITKFNCIYNVHVSHCILLLERDPVKGIVVALYFFKKKLDMDLVQRLLVS